MRNPLIPAKRNPGATCTHYVAGPLGPRLRGDEAGLNEAA